MREAVIHQQLIARIHTTHVLVVVLDYYSGFSMSSTPPSAAHDLLDLTIMLLLWYVLSIRTSCLSLHFRARTPLSLLLLTCPVVSFILCIETGIPLRSLHAVPHKPLLGQVLELGWARVEVACEDNIILPHQHLVIH